MSNKSFKMLVEQGKDATLFDPKLISEVNGEAKAGHVFTIYALPSDQQELTQARTLERREKYLILDEISDNNQHVTMSIHKVNDYGYYQTTKLRNGENSAIEQVQVPISQACFKHLAVIALHGIKFERFKIDVPNSELVWEVDVFRTNGGQRHPWVKIDLEVEDMNNPVPPLPFKCDDYILDFPGIVTEEESNFIDNLYRTQWMSLDPEWVVNKVDYKKLVTGEAQRMGVSGDFNSFLKY